MTTSRAGRSGFSFELAVVLLLGFASLGTAWATFQASLYDGKQAAQFAEGQSLRTQAESLYLEGNQQFTQDSATLGRLAELSIAAAAGDEVASAQYDELLFMNVSPELEQAMARADELNSADDAVYYTSPLEDEDYLAALFGSYTEMNEQGDAATAKAYTFSTRSDQLTLAMTAMAIALFLGGIAAVVRGRGAKMALLIGGGVFFVLGAVATLVVPITWL